MSLRIRGMGWVTPLGSEIDEVWQRFSMATRADGSDRFESDQRSQLIRFSVSPGDAQRPRIRVCAAPARSRASRSWPDWRRCEDAGVESRTRRAARTALIFAISNGGVIYTKRFYHDIVESGAQAASPLFFPETVFNAPASHLAAILGITGASYTLVGDGAVGILALKMAEDLMAMNRSIAVSWSARRKPIGCSAMPIASGGLLRHCAADRAIRATAARNDPERRRGRGLSGREGSDHAGSG